MGAQLQHELVTCGLHQRCHAEQQRRQRQEPDRDPDGDRQRHLDEVTALAVTRLRQQSRHERHPGEDREGRHHRTERGQVRCPAVGAFRGCIALGEVLRPLGPVLRHLLQRNGRHDGRSLAGVTLRRSVLDLSILNAGQTSAAALATTTALAKHADELGFERFWVAEHHNMPTVACTTPLVLIAHLAANTTRIRVGSGGVMLPNHAPLVVAEQFAMLEALYPGRIDVGIGRAPGTDHATAAALRRTRDLAAENFPSDLIDLMGLLGDPRTAEGMWQRFSATPAATTFPPIFLLGSSDYSARLAARLGLGFGFAHHFDLAGNDLRTTINVAALYRDQFTPSPVLAEPHLIVTANVLAADTAEEAEFHAGPGRLTALGRRTGRFHPLPSPQTAAIALDIETARRLPTSRIVGDAATVNAELDRLGELTGADELMVTCVAYDLSARVRSLELLSRT